MSTTSWSNLPNGSNAIGAIKITDNSLWVWGNNTLGQLGLNTVNASVLSPLQVAGAWSYVSISSTSCGIKTDGTLWAWGDNSSGQLSQNDLISRSSPVQIGTDNTWLKCVSRYSPYTLMAIKQDGTLWAAGANTAGQIGDNTVINRSSLVQSGTDNNWADVQVGANFAIGLKGNGTMWSLGDGASYNTGQGTVADTSSWIQIGTANNWVQISTINGPSFARNSLGELYAWGIGQAGGTGTNQIGVVANPTKILDNVIQVAAGPNYGLALKDDYTAWCWGTNTLGQLGTGDKINYSSPTQLGVDTNWRGIEANFGNSFGWKVPLPTPSVTASPTVTPSVTPSPTPSPSPSPTPAPSATIAPFTNYDLYAWGYNTFGQMGNSTVINKSSPVFITSGTYATAPAGFNTYGTVTADGRLLVWGYNFFGSIGDGTVVYKSSPVQIGGAVWSSADINTTCVATKKDGTLWTWGYNIAGGLGQNDVISRSSPTQVGVDTDWNYSIASGFNGSGGTVFAIKKDGSLWGIGENTSGQLGMNTAINYSSPVQIGLSTNWSKVYTGQQYSIALKTDGTLWGVGLNTSNQLGTGVATTRSSWVQIGNSNQWISVSTTWDPTLALKSDNTLWSWGIGGLLGTGVSGNATTPVQVGVDKTWSKIAGGRNAGFAIENTGRLWVWGSNSYGQLGISGTVAYSSMVQTTLADTNWADIFAGNVSLQALRIPPASPTPTVTPSPTPTQSPIPTESPTPSPTSVGCGSCGYVGVLIPPSNLVWIEDINGCTGGCGCQPPVNPPAFEGDVAQTDCA